MSSILVFCRTCGRQVSSAETRDGVCLECRVRSAVADLRGEHLRLWRKRERYRSSGANEASISSQIARVEDRIGQRIRELVPSERAAVELLRKELEEARQARYLIGGV